MSLPCHNCMLFGKLVRQHVGHTCVAREPCEWCGGARVLHTAERLRVGVWVVERRQCGHCSRQLQEQASVA
jgi:hypothetical protein